MKIVFIIDSLQRYGAQRFLTHLVHGLHDRGYTQRVIALNDATDRDIEQNLSTADCAITRIGKILLLSGGAGWWALVAMLKREMPDVVVTILDFADTLGRPAARLARCRRLVTSIRVRNLTKPAWQRWIGRRTIKWADRVVFNSTHVVEYGRQQEGVREDQVVVIPNGVEDLRGRRAGLRDRYRQELGVSPATAILGSVGRLYPQKNLSLLLRALAMLPVSRPWKVLLIGEGPQRPKLLRLARKLGLSDRIIWLGSRSDVEGWLAAMDIFIHTADFEGMPNAVMEAMSMGLPVIASAVDGTRELISDGVSGYLVAPGDADSFAKRIVQIIDNPDLAHRLGEQAHHDILAHFGMVQMIDAYDQLFLSLINTRTA